MKNRKLLGSKEINPKRLGAKPLFIPKSAGHASFKSSYAVPSYTKPNYSFSSN